MIFDGALAASGNDYDLVASGRQRLFYAILNDGLIDQRQHFFRLSLGGWEKARAESGGGENRFADFPDLAAVAIRSSFVHRILFERLPLAFMSGARLLRALPTLPADRAASAVFLRRCRS